MGSDAWWQGHLEQVLFACLTNRRRWVFHSETRGAAGLAREGGAFYGCRLATGAVDWAMMFVLAERMGLDDVAVKAAANVVVIVLNYVASRLVVFRVRSGVSQAPPRAPSRPLCCSLRSLPFSRI